MADAPVPPSLHRLRSFPLHDGLLTVWEFGDDLPFEPRRVFFVSQVPHGVTRAGHAHRQGAELLLAVAGQCTVEAYTDDDLSLYRLDDPATALHVPPGNWITCLDFSPGAVLVVLSSIAYDPGDQIEDFEEYRAFAASLANV